MPYILLVDKTASVKPYLTKQFVEEDLYKRAGFKSKEGFALQTSWTIPVGDKSPYTPVGDKSPYTPVGDKSPYTIDLYGKTVGRAGQENKYEFPPPVDTVLYFGTCVLVGRSGNTIIDLAPQDWQMAYQYLYGGFEDIGSSSDEEESEENDGVARTKDGYAKDGFVVDDDEDEDEDEASSEEEPQPPKRTPAPKPSAKSKTPAEPNIEMVIYPEEDAYLNCSCELTEESYIA